MDTLPRRAVLAMPLEVAAVAVARTAGSESTAAPLEAEPQYLSMHKTPTGGPPPGVYWYEQNPSSIGQSGIDEILKGVGTRGSRTRRLAFAFTLSYLNNPLHTEQQCVRNLLRLAEANDLPVFIHLDGVNWWNARPDLWNWWNKAGTGYNRRNVANVEWFDWGSQHAVMIGWRDWGQQIRVPPHPNLAAPAFLAAQDACLRVLVPMVVDWYRRLPVARRYLLGGVVLGWEVSTYTNAYYYPNGNAYLQRWPDTTVHDPTGGVAASIPLGYAAATTLGRTHPGALTTQDMDGIIRFYLDHVASLAADLGLPRDKLWTHSIIYDPASSGLGALTPYAQPGWSFYNMRPQDARGPLTPLDGTPWAAVEFQPWGLSSGLFARFFAYRNCRLINVFNWESIRWSPSSVAAVRQTLSAQPPVVVQSATDLRAQPRAGGVVLRWTPGAGAVRTTLQVARAGTVDLAGTLGVPLVVQREVTGLREFRLDLAPGVYHWVLVSTGAAMVPPPPPGLPFALREQLARDTTEGERTATCLRALGVPCPQRWVVTGGERIATPVQSFAVPGS